MARADWQNRRQEKMVDLDSSHVYGADQLHSLRNRHRANLRRCMFHERLPVSNCLIGLLRLTTVMRVSIVKLAL